MERQETLAPLPLERLELLEREDPPFLVVEQQTELRMLLQESQEVDSVVPCLSP